MTLQLSAGRQYLIDTSALARHAHEYVRPVLVGLLADGLAATCATVDLEAGYSGRNYADVQKIAEQRLAAYHRLPLTEEAAQRAQDVQVRLARRGHHRSAGVIDLLTAAVAELNDAVILHYDRDFEFIADVTGQPQMWIAPPGSIH